MSKFLMQVSLTRDGAKGLAKDGGTKRKQVAEQFFKSVGGTVEAFYFAFGETDVFAIVDVAPQIRVLAKAKVCARQARENVHAE